MNKGRKLLVTGIVVLVLAAVAGVGAFGFRSMNGVIASEAWRLRTKPETPNEIAVDTMRRRILAAAVQDDPSDYIALYDQESSDPVSDSVLAERWRELRIGGIPPSDAVVMSMMSTGGSGRGEWVVFHLSFRYPDGKFTGWMDPRATHAMSMVDGEWALTPFTGEE